METTKILIYGKDGETKIVLNGKVQEGEAFFEEDKNSTIANCLYNLARVLYSCAENEDVAYEVAVISNVYYKVMTSQLKQETWTGIETFYTGSGDNRKMNTRELGDAELEVRQHVINSMQAAFCNTNILNLKDVADDADWRSMIDMVKPRAGLKVTKEIKAISGISLS